MWVEELRLQWSREKIRLREDEELRWRDEVNLLREELEHLRSVTRYEPSMSFPLSLYSHSFQQTRSI